MRDAAINNAEGEKQQVIKASEARKQQQINEAEGQAEAILAVATATAEGIKRVADAINDGGGHDAVQLRVAEQYVTQFGQLAKGSTNLVLPANVGDVGSMIALAMNVFNQQSAKGVPAKPAYGPGRRVRPGSDPRLLRGRRARSQARRSRAASAFKACSASYQRTSLRADARSATRASAAAFVTNVSRVANWNSIGSCTGQRQVAGRVERREPRG